ncbi:AdipoR/hemolysin-III-related [Dillenia turbinata]|uniref:AdipoR/hemolysin-III-related n=1 Tax=Dillenia turbinata TaxID=194707 RepID=A0AAN8W5V8_9MAGN
MEKLKTKTETMKKLLKYEELPEYMKDNEYILDHYRCEWPLKDVIFSVFAWHNETLNIWTHLGGFLVFVGLTVISSTRTSMESLLASFARPLASEWNSLMVSNSTNISGLLSPDWLLNHSSQSSMFSSSGEDDVKIPRWPWFVFLGGAMGCLLCSSISHLLACHSKRYNLFFWRLDYAGISLMIVCSFFAPIYYAFYCNPYSRIFYLTSISILGITTIITLLAPVFSSPRFRSFRAALFLTMGFLGVIPAAHAVVLHWGHPHVFVAIGYELLMGVLYAVGTGFYVGRVPEKWKPGAFDIAGHSHQIFHVFVVAGVLAHCAATLVIFDWCRRSPTCDGGYSPISWAS